MAELNLETEIEIRATAEGLRRVILVVADCDGLAVFTRDEAETELTCLWQENADLVDARDGEVPALTCRRRDSLALAGPRPVPSTTPAPDPRPA